MNTINSSIKIILSALSFVLLIIFCIGCEKEEVFNELELKKFSDFGCEAIIWYLKPGNTKNHYVINSQSELDNILETDCQPQIDFDKYTLIVGTKSFTTGATLQEENILESNSEITYTITFLTDISMIAMGVRYHAIIEKNRKKINVVEIVKESQ